MSAIIEVRAGGWSDPPGVLAGLQGFTIHPQGPVITQQPLETWIGAGEPVEFTAEVRSEPGLQL